MNTELKNLETPKIIALILILMMSLYFLIMVRGILTPFVLGIILAYVLNPVVLFLEKRRVPRNTAIICTFVVLVSIIALLLIFILPGILAQINRFVANIPAYITQIQEFIASIEQQYAHLIEPEILQELTDRTITEGLLRIQTMLTNIDVIVSNISNILSNILTLILTPVLAAYMLKDGRKFRTSFYRMIPKQHKNFIIPLVEDINEVLSGFFHGYILVSIIIGTSATIMLLLLGSRFYLILGIIAGFTNLIPYFGPFIGAVPALIVAAFDSPSMILRIAIGYTILQQIESLVISPRILGGKTGLHPLSVLFAVMAGGTLWGIPGMILGVPITATIKIVFSHIIRLAL